jgi:DNA-binding transcriptional regulator YiaG
LKKRYQSEMLQVIHEDMKGMYELGIISDAEMRKFDKECLVQEPKPVYKSVSSARKAHINRVSAKNVGS